MYRSFNNLAKFYTSMAAVMIGLLCLIIFMVFETQTLFFRMLPADMGYTKKLFASSLVAIVFEFSVLITTANTRLLRRSVPVVLACSGFVLILWFWRAWEGDPILIFYKVFVSAIQAYLNYLYSDLFMKKWREQSLTEDKTNLEQEYSELQQKLANVQQAYSHIEQQVVDRKRLLSETTCPHCGNNFNSKNALNAHVGRCKEIINHN